MAEKSIEEKVKDIIVEQLGVNPEQVTPQASFIEDLGADSLDIVELVMAFEEEVSVEVPDGDAQLKSTHTTAAQWPPRPAAHVFGCAAQLKSQCKGCNTSTSPYFGSVIT